MTSTSVPARAPDVAVSLIRTWVPIAAGAAITAIAAWRGIVVDVETSAVVATMATAAVSAAYYGLARLLESRRGTGGLSAVARTTGRWMLGGLVSKPAYLSDAEYAHLVALAKRTPDGTP